MIPVRLALKNFMCYRDNVPPLSFEGIHIACLCGDNGNGKSAIFDAMTWALWGKSRARNDDDLIHLGQSEMEIELKFVSGEQQYRVIRKHAMKPSKARAGQTVLEFQIAGNGTFRSISGNSLMETQQKIIDVLNLDYETFKNSAFLRQGHADEFSIKRPGERKEVLANILGLSHYDELESGAKEQSGIKRMEADRLEVAISDIELQLANRAMYEEETRKIQSEITQFEDKRKSEETAISSLRSQKADLEIKKEQLSNTKIRLNETKNELEHREAKIKEYQARITEYELVLEDKAAIEKGYSEFQSVKTQNDEFNRKLSQLFALRERITNVDQAIKKAAQALTIEHKVIQAQFSENEVKFAKTMRLEESLTQARKHLLELAEHEEIVAKKRKQIQQAASRISYLESTNMQLSEEIAGLNEKLKLLTGDSVRCPLCETELGTEGRQQIETKLTAEVQHKTKARQKNDEDLSKKRTKLEAIENELTANESDLNKERSTRHSQLGMIEKELSEAREVGKELSQQRARLEELEQQMVRKDYAVYEQQALAKLEDEERKLGYSKEKHEEMRQQLAGLQKYENLQRELDEAIKNIDKEKIALAEAKETISNLQKTVAADLKKQENLSSQLLSLPGIIDQLTKEEEMHRISLQKERQVRDSLAALQERLRQIEELEISKQEKTKLLQEALNEESIYKELADAFSKKGIQALLIEQALPEIELEANRLLAKMTDNRMSLRLESQRETKKGDTVETLNIKIADELGTRNYEMYSGGEAFRIDLALRIALSMLLVRRAGASLPILIIDEGFGTQDSAAREKLIEAINSIQDDFEKIIVITHLEEMKDKFETLINVTKTANGSMISVS